MRLHNETTDDSDSVEAWTFRAAQAEAIREDTGLGVALITLESGERGFGLFVQNEAVVRAARWGIGLMVRSYAHPVACPVYVLPWEDCASDLYCLVDAYHHWLMHHVWAES